MRKRLGQFLGRVVALDDTPERIALAFALGVFLAFSPLLGLHTLLGLTISFLFGLNRMVILVGVFVNNPWTLVPIYAAGTYVGSLLVGFPSRPALPSFGWNQLWHSTFWWQLASQWHILKPLMVGSSILSVLAALAAYFVALHVIRQGRACYAKL